MATTVKIADDAGPALERREQLVSVAEPAEHALARGGDLHRLTDDGQDDQVADQRRKRPVIVASSRANTTDATSAMTLLTIIAPASPAARLSVGTLEALNQQRNSVSHARRTVAERMTRLTKRRPT